MPAASPGYDAATENGDLPLVGGLVTGPELTLQRLNRRIKTHLGEALVDRFAGIDWLAWFLTLPLDLDMMVGFIRVQCDTCPGIARTVDLTGAFDPATRTATFRGQVALAPDGQLAAITIGVGNDNGNPAVTLLLLQPAPFFA